MDDTIMLSYDLTRDLRDLFVMHQLENKTKIPNYLLAIHIKQTIDNITRLVVYRDNDNEYLKRREQILEV